MEQYLGSKQSNKENEIANQKILLPKNYITDKMLDACSDNVVSDNVLPFG